MDVCLTNYGHCNYVSGKHACIFYDEVRSADGVGGSSPNLRPLAGTGFLFSALGEGKRVGDIVSFSSLPVMQGRGVSWCEKGILLWLPAPQEQGCHIS